MQTLSAVDYPIKSVTVFKSSKAEVNRTFSLKLKTGQNKVQISDLSSYLDTESIRVSGLDEARLFDVVCTIQKKQAIDISVDHPSEVIRLLETKKNGLQSQKRVMEHQADLLVSYAKTLTGEHVSPTAMSDFLKSFVTKGSENLEAVAQIDEKIVEINRQIAKETAKAALKTGEANGQVTVVIVAASEASVELKLTYIVHGASWEPTYELHATTESGKPSSAVSLHYRARVTQSTGEDWSNSALTLSTVTSDMIARSIPQLSITKVHQRRVRFADKDKTNPFHDPSAVQTQGPGLFTQARPAPSGSLFCSTFSRPPVFGQPAGGSLFGQPSGGASGSGLFGAPAATLFGGGSSQAPPNNAVEGFGAFGAFGAFGQPNSTASQQPQSGSDPVETEDDAFEEIAGPGSFSEPTTVVTESPLSISYAVEGQSTIPSDGVAHQVSVAVLSFESKITYVCCPKIEPRVYLQCEVKNTSEFRLLQGPVSVFLDDSYVSKTSIQDVNPSDTFECTFGSDPLTRVSYSRTFKTLRVDSGAFAEAHNTTTYTNTTTIHNKHRFPLSEVIIRDIIPLADDNRVKVHLKNPDGLADAKDGQVVELKKVAEGLKVRWSPLVDGKGGEKQGRFEFLSNVDVGGKAIVESGWEVKAPADLRWQETTGWSF